MTIVHSVVLVYIKNKNNYILMYKWRSVSGGALSHTLMSGGSLSVPTGESTQFMKTYIEEVTKMKLYVVELKTPSFYMFMDVDYVGESKLSRDEIVSIVHKIHQVIPGRCVAAVAKPKPKDSLIKSGIHIHWPETIVDKSHAIELMDEVKASLPDLASFIDDSVYKGSGLRMLWSHKKGKCGDEDPYIPFYDANNKKFFEKQNPSFHLLKLFSIRYEDSVIKGEEVTPKNETDIEMFVYRCMNDERRYKNCKEPFDTARITKMTRDKNMVFVQTPSRYCMNTKRCHKSNHVYYVINLERGVLYQKCFDENCKSYEGLHHKMSPQILEEFDKNVPDVHFAPDDIYSAFAIDRGAPRDV